MKCEECQYHINPDYTRCKECEMAKEIHEQQFDDAISRQEVQDLLATWLSDYLTDETREALETIDGKVGDMPSVTPKAEHCEDAISREQALKLFATHDGHYLYEAIRDLPPVTPKQRTGHWIEVTNGRGGHECNLCHEYAPSYQDGDEWLTKHCPNCGARMEEQA